MHTGMDGCQRPVNLPLAATATADAKHLHHRRQGDNCSCSGLGRPVADLNFGGSKKRGDHLM